ncbi:MAG: 50S ribosomal protein L4 [Aeropyrum sp.]|nr:50S ribosomal protein L4 [Aeropyrum sp.]
MLQYTYLTMYSRSGLKAPLFNSKGEEQGDIDLPPVFGIPVRKDIIRRVYLSEFTARLQPKGRDPMAGKRTSAVSLGVGRGVARVPRVKGSLRAALVNMARGGRVAHPPRVEKRVHERVNKKERTLGTMSAIAATAILDMVKSRGHMFSIETLPPVLDSEVLNEVTSTKQANILLQAIGVYQDVVRARERRRVRAGKGKMRGRKYVTPKSILFVVEDIKSPFARSVKSLPGVDVVEPRLLSVLHLAPGGVPGRLTVYTTRALEALGNRFRVMSL